MKSLKIGKLRIILIAILTALVISLLTSGLVGIFTQARSVTIGSSSSIFVSSTGTARVRAMRVENTENAANPYYYTMFGVTTGGTVSYRKNLAYHWMENTGVSGADVLEKGEGYLNMEIGFDELNFESFRLTFESQQYTKDNSDTKTTNYVVFVPVAESESTVNVVITTDSDDVQVTNTTALNKDRISIKLSNYVDGTYDVTVTDNVSTVTGEFENVGGTYAKYSSSTTNPLYPLIFSAEFADEDTEDYADIALYSLNGQSFSLTGVSTAQGENEAIDYYYGGTVTDNLAPVLCLDEQIKYLEVNEQLSVNYTLVDVLSTNTTSEISYFMLNKSQVNDTTGVSTELNTVTNPAYKTIESSDNQYLIQHATSYDPEAGTDYKTDTYDGEYLVVDGAVKVAIKITDSSSSASNYVFLDWYIAEDYLITPKDVDTVPFVALARDELGATFAYTQGTTSNPEDGEWTDKVAAYQEAVDKATSGLKAGSGNYFFLPSAQTLLSDNATDFSDLTLYMYYISSSGRSSVSGKPGSISLSLSTSGRYIFTIFASDSNSNEMYYFDSTGELVEFNSGEIWDMYDADDDGDYADAYAYLPWFNFEVTSSELTIEDAEEQDTAYVGTSYSFSSTAFEVNGTAYNTTYRLFRFDSSEYYRDNDENLLYSEFLARKAELFTEHRDYFEEIMSSSESNNEGYYLYEKYAWNGSTSFTPQDDNSFYLVVCTLRSTESTTRPAQYGYMAILSSALAQSLKGEDTWVQDNLASIILLSIAGAALIGIVIILLIKPKDKGDLDAQLEVGEKLGKQNGKKKGKKSKDETLD